MKYYKYRGILAVVLVSVISLSCKKKVSADKNTDPNLHYFSINQYALDQWNTFAGEPFVIIKTVKQNGKTDTSLTNSDTINWAPIFKTFSETDISDNKYIDQYDVSHFPDNQDLTMNLLYQARDEDQFTQKLLIAIDQYNLKVKGIYIETYKKTAWSACTQKLYYSPMKTIQIQTDDRPVIGGKKYTIVEYTFMR